MLLSFWSRQINDILTANDSIAQRAIMLLDRYDCLADSQRDEFVTALVHRLLVECSRHLLAPKAAIIVKRKA